MPGVKRAGFLRNEKLQGTRHMIKTFNVGSTKNLISQKKQNCKDNKLQGWYNVKDVLRHQT